MDPTKLLKKQHREVQALFRQVEKTESGNRRRDLMNQIVESLQLHMKIEEEIFYPALREIGTKKAEELTLEAYEEHGVAKLVMKQLPQVDPNDDRFEAKMTVFKELIAHHVDEEEHEMFKLAGKIGEDELNVLGNRMMEAIARASGHEGPAKSGRNGRPRGATASR
jgi:hemerythrin superfamily protein